VVNGKIKGGKKEREIAVELSRWITHGEKDDCLWRSALSGGRATVSHRKGKILANQSGDLSAISPEGHILTDRFYIEIKHLKDISLDCLIKGKGVLLNIWWDTEKKAALYNKIPTLIFQQNYFPTVFCTNGSGISMLNAESSVCVTSGTLYLIRFDDLMKSVFPL